MSWRDLFLSFEGRINRARYWIGVLILVVANIAVTAGIYFGLGLPLETFAQDTAIGSQVNLATTLVLLYPSLAVLVKRLHDRDRTGWWAAALYALSLGADAIDAMGYGGTAENPSIVFLSVLIPLGLLSLWLLVELGFLKGMARENRFGPDPLGGETAASEATTAPGSGTTRTAEATTRVATGEATVASPAAPPAAHRQESLDWSQLLFGFGGRIARKRFWIGLIVVSVAGSIALTAVAAVIGTFVETPEAAGLVVLAPALAIILAMLVCSIAVSVKRLHDRNKSGWWMALYYGLILAQTAAVGSGMMAPPGTPELVSIAATLFNFAIVLYYLVDLGFVKGTFGPNRFGPDPLGPEGASGQTDASF